MKHQNLIRSTCACLKILKFSNKIDEITLKSGKLGENYGREKEQQIFSQTLAVSNSIKMQMHQRKRFFCCVKETRTTWRGNPQNIRLKELFLYLSLLSSDSYVEKVHSEAQNEGFSIYFRIYIVFNPSTTSTFCFIFWLENPIYTWGSKTDVAALLFCTFFLFLLYFVISGLNFLCTFCLETFLPSIGAWKRPRLWLFFHT